MLDIDWKVFWEYAILIAVCLGAFLLGLLVYMICWWREK